MTLETINKALQHPFKIRDPTTLTLKTITEATIANLTALKEDATASAIKITSLEGDVATLTSNQSTLLAPLEADVEASQFEVYALKADIVELKEENAEKGETDRRVGWGGDQLHDGVQGRERRAQ